MKKQVRDVAVINYLFCPFNLDFYVAFLGDF